MGVNGVLYPCGSSCFPILFSVSRFDHLNYALVVAIIASICLYVFKC
jgi:hypothetical protein